MPVFWIRNPPASAIDETFDETEEKPQRGSPTINVCRYLCFYRMKTVDVIMTNWPASSVPILLRTPEIKILFVFLGTAYTTGTIYIPIGNKANHPLHHSVLSSNSQLCWIMPQDREGPQRRTALMKSCGKKPMGISSSAPKGQEWKTSVKAIAGKGLVLKHSMDPEEVSRNEHCLKLSTFLKRFGELGSCQAKLDANNLPFRLKNR